MTFEVEKTEDGLEVFLSRICQRVPKFWFNCLCYFFLQRVSFCGKIVKSNKSELWNPLTALHFWGWQPSFQSRLKCLWICHFYLKRHSTSATSNSDAWMQILKKESNYKISCLTLTNCWSWGHLHREMKRIRQKMFVCLFVTADSRQGSLAKPLYCCS